MFKKISLILRTFFITKYSRILALSFLLILAANSVFASGGTEEAGHGSSLTLLWIAFILIAAKVGSLVERFGQPAVLGELLIGVILGNLALLGFNLFESIKQDDILLFLSELGVIILLFQIGLESNIQQMKKVGFRALLVAVVG